MQHFFINLTLNFTLFLFFFMITLHKSAHEIDFKTFYDYVAYVYRQTIQRLIALMSFFTFSEAKNYC